MRVIRSFFLAVSVYSKLPVPQLAWEKEDMKYVLCFFPWIGALIGICVWLWNQLCMSCRIGDLCRLAIDLAIPLLITGGFHADGFLDVMDACHSYQSRERKLEILSDAHIGAFAVLMLTLYGLVYLGAFSEITEDGILRAVCAGFFLSRCLCGISVLSFSLAKKEGMLYAVADSSTKGIVRKVLYLQGMACIVFMVSMAGICGLFISLSFGAVYGYYFYRSRKEFGGITGDTSGYFVLLCEVCMVVTAAMETLIKSVFS